MNRDLKVGCDARWTKKNVRSKKPRVDHQTHDRFSSHTLAIAASLPYDTGAVQKPTIQ